MRQSKFITGFQGARDCYQLPLSLYEIGRLERHVSELYLGDCAVEIASRFRWRVASRRNSKLPPSVVKISYAVLALNLIGRAICKAVDRERKFDRIDQLISKLCGELSRATQSDLFLHAGYALEAFQLSPNVQKLLFFFHPFEKHFEQLFLQDFELYPEIRSSFEADLMSRQDSPRIMREKQEVNLADQIYCASTITKKSIEFAGFSSKAITVVPYGCDTPPFSQLSSASEPRNSAQPHTRFLFVGQGVQRKGLHHLLRVWTRLRLTSATLTLVLNRVDPGLALPIRKAGAVVLSALSPQELEFTYLNSDVLVQPSLLEGFGLVYLEALRFGIHCIGTSNTGLMDINISSKHITIIEPGNLEALTEAIVVQHERVQNNENNKIETAEEVHRTASWQAHRAKLVASLP